MTPRENIRHYMIHIDGEPYSRDQYAKNKKDAIKLFKKFWNIQKMPKGYAIWEMQP